VWLPRQPDPRRSDALLRLADISPAGQPGPCGSGRADWWTGESPVSSSTRRGGWLASAVKHGIARPHGRLPSNPPGLDDTVQGHRATLSLRRMILVFRVPAGRPAPSPGGRLSGQAGHRTGPTHPQRHAVVGEDRDRPRCLAMSLPEQRAIAGSIRLGPLRSPPEPAARRADPRADRRYRTGLTTVTSS
jgi:hypothetical protein